MRELFPLSQSYFLLLNFIYFIHCIYRIHFIQRYWLITGMLFNLTIISFISLPVMASNVQVPQGWHWYNEISLKAQENKDNKDNKDNKNHTGTSALSELTYIQQQLKLAKAKAVLHPSEDNVYHYLVLQTAVTNQASRFAMMWPKVLLDHPDIDYSINHPTDEIALQHQRSKSIAEKNEAVMKITQHQGLLFFYRGADVTDQAMGGMLADFVKIYSIAFIPISIDHAVAENLPETRLDNGQAKKLGIHYFPALLLVNPKTETVTPVAYGFLSEDQLLDRFLALANNFNGGW